MKQEIYKKSFERYVCVKYKDQTPIGENFHIKNCDVFGIKDMYGPTEKHPFFAMEDSIEGEEHFVKNFANPMYSVMKDYLMMVVERNGDKVAIKVFKGAKWRREGKSYFKVTKDVNYISVNVKTGDVYHGYIKNYQKKKKCSKMIRRNSFLMDPVNTLKSNTKNLLTQFTEKAYEEVMMAFSEFMFQIDQRNDFQTLTYGDRLFRFYLDKRNFKYPNNFGIYVHEFYGPEIKKILKKNGNRLVDSVMIKHELSGKKIKKALHTCSRLNMSVYKTARKTFGDDWLNQDDDNVIVDLLDSTIGDLTVPDLFIELISKEELKRVYSIFKQVYIHQDLDAFTFQDHIRMYTELKMYGEQDLKWTSYEDKSEFRKEHLDWTDRLQHYKRGEYTRHYPEYMYEKISQPIVGEYYPILLNESSSYNEESNTQSNCVKGYIGKPSSLIISVRKGGIDSEERATVEYRLTKKDDEIRADRVQSLGKYNEKLVGMWEIILLNLDLDVLSCVRDERFEPVKLTKKCNNGTILESDSYWNDSGLLRWTTPNIDNNRSIYFNGNYNFEI